MLVKDPNKVQEGPVLQNFYLGFSDVSFKLKRSGRDPHSLLCLKMGHSRPLISLFSSFLYS